MSVSDTSLTLYTSSMLGPATTTPSAPSTPLFASADLVVDRVYQGGRAGNAGDDPISKLIGTSNQGGFRYLGNLSALKLVVLVSSFTDSDWPDHVDLESGLLVYFGDNKKPGCQLLETKRFGNQILDRLFAMAHGAEGDRRRSPPILVFASTGSYRDTRFLGLAVPGALGSTSNEDLVAVWRSSRGERFQNYRALFTLLNTSTVTRAWLNDIKRGDPHTACAPKAWRDWIRRKRYDPLAAKATVAWRTKAQQLPKTDEERRIISGILAQFQRRPTDFEHCAATLVRLMDDRFSDVVVTRATRDGGRDAIGTYRIAKGPAAIAVEFALEAKCYSASNPVGVKEVSRLISRLRHRQFGLLVTTSYLAEQAYQEIVEDGHPIGVLAGIDIARLLIAKGLGEHAALTAWLDYVVPQPVRVPVS